MKCIYCGEEIKQKRNAGKARRICYKVECEKKYRAEMMRNYYKKKKLGLPVSTRGRRKEKKQKEQEVEFVQIARGKKEIVCEVCGSVAVVSKNKRFSVCNNPTCEAIAKKNAEEKQKESTVRTYREDEIMYVKDLLPVADELAMEVLDFAKRAGQIRYEGLGLINKLGQMQSKNDTQDQEHLHWIESAQSMTAGEIIKKVIEEANNRANRRDTKTLQRIVSDIINRMPPNPHEYAQRMIKGAAKADVTYAIRHEENKKVEQGESK